MMINKKTGETMSYRDFANKMLSDIFSSKELRNDPIKLDQALWSVEDFCKKVGLTYYKDPMNYQIEIY